MNIPHISVATTAGTGSEVSPIAVIYNEHKKVKMNIYNVFFKFGCCDSRSRVNSRTAV
ncbi:iron-containing alcohol dehydrogenase [Peribacillus frigoritolerans]|nr:iron-containing alcohol dehydrogenase [Peribacillus frigoritolerans]